MTPDPSRPLPLREALQRARWGHQRCGGCGAPDGRATTRLGGRGDPMCRDCWLADEAAFDALPAGEPVPDLDPAERLTIEAQRVNFYAWSRALTAMLTGKMDAVDCAHLAVLLGRLNDALGSDRD